MKNFIQFPHYGKFLPNKLIVVAEIIEGGKLFKGGNCSRKYGTQKRQNKVVDFAIQYSLKNVMNLEDLNKGILKAYFYVYKNGYDLFQFFKD